MFAQADLKTKLKKGKHAKFSRNGIVTREFNLIQYFGRLQKNSKL